MNETNKFNFQLPLSIEQETLAVLKEIRDSAFRSEKFLHDILTRQKMLTAALGSKGSKTSER